MRHYSNEAAWATLKHRRLRAWWETHRVILAIMLVVIFGLVIALQNANTRANEADADASYMASALLKSSCYAKTYPTGLVMVGTSQELLGEALRSAASEADSIRLAWALANERAKRK